MHQYRGFVIEFQSNTNTWNLLCSGVLMFSGYESLKDAKAWIRKNYDKNGMRK